MNGAKGEKKLHFDSECHKAVCLHSIAFHTYSDALLVFKVKKAHAVCEHRGATQNSSVNEAGEL